MNISSLAYNQPDNSGSLNISVLQGYRTKLVSMRDMILHEINQRRITPNTIDVLIRELSDIIKGIDDLLNALHSEKDYDTLEKVQIDVRNARKCLLIASSILEGTTRLSSTTVLFDKYDEFTDILLEAIKLLEILIT